MRGITLGVPATPDPFGAWPEWGEHCRTLDVAIGRTGTPASTLSAGRNTASFRSLPPRGIHGWVCELRFVDGRITHHV